MTSKIEPVETARGNTNLSPKKKQCIQLTRFFFTFNNYAKSDIDTLNAKFRDICKSYVFQEEKGESGTPHLQGCIWLKKKMRWTEFNLPKQIHWEKVINWNESVKYCSKEETRNGDIYSYGLPKQLKIIKDLKPWQNKVIDIINEDPDDRTVYWIYDAKGCMGKTVFSKYLYVKHNAIIATGGGNKDIACMIAILKKEGRDLNDKTTFIFNFPRCTEGISYKAIESVKDGLITSVKYESSTLVFNCPHVICFSNELPKINKLSRDRWKLFEIQENEDLKSLDLKDLEVDDVEIL